MVKDVILEEDSTPQKSGNSFQQFINLKNLGINSTQDRWRVPELKQGDRT
ncbi:MAG: hypothetical protein F6K17_24285 [Okeania sp. SIO3C4]|nr:hypothetical protein [Okeania sp. SIO3C4]